MKKLFSIKTLMFTLVLGVMSCSSDGDSIGESQINTAPPILNDLDLWLRDNFVKDYNIEILYKWDINDTDLSRYIHPPYPSSVRPMAEALKKAWIEPYTTLGGPDFIKKIAPRQFTFAGGFNFDPNTPTRILGIAEAGSKITLFDLDYLDFTNINSIKEPLKTVHHEYGHILNQTVPIPIIYSQINPENYDASWFNRSNAQARELGYITAYASSQSGEDFVEMVSEMLTHSRADFDAIVESIQSAEAYSIIRFKESIVVEYYRTNFGIDIYELQQLTDAATQELVN